MPLERLVEPGLGGDPRLDVVPDRRLQLPHGIQRRNLFTREPNAEDVLQLEHEIDVSDRVPRGGIAWARARRDRGTVETEHLTHRCNEARIEL